MPFKFDPKDNDPRNTLGKKLKKVIVNSMFQKYYYQKYI